MLVAENGAPKAPYDSQEREKVTCIRIPGRLAKVRIPCFHVAAFADGPLRGNPAAVCPLDSWLDDRSLLKVAAEINLPATAFLVPQGDGYELRWFTTVCEIRLCGHATLAAGFVILKSLQPGRQTIDFQTRYSGALQVRSTGDHVEMDFPALFPKQQVEPPKGLLRALRIIESPAEVLEANNILIAVLGAQQDVAAARPDSDLLRKLHPSSVAITAPGDATDFVSRYFAPGYGIPEDAVTGSLHCALTPYWSKRLGKSKLHARQLSERGGELWCELVGKRVKLSGKATLTTQGSLTI